MTYVVSLGRRWYRPSYEEVCAVEDAARHHETRIFAEVTAKILEIPIDLVVGLVDVVPLRGVLDLVHSRDRLCRLFSSMGTFGSVLSGCHAEIMLRKAFAVPEEATSCAEELEEFVVRVIDPRRSRLGHPRDLMDSSDQGNLSNPRRTTASLFANLSPDDFTSE